MQRYDDVFRKPLKKKIKMFLITALVALVLGSMVGFAMGGGNPFKVFLPTTWLHLFDFLK